MRVHVWQQFQSVGHGTFFTGNIRDSSGASFSWAYDCGSKRPTRVSEAIASLDYTQDWPSDHDLDMVVVSHFDDDHINGLETLLTQHRVKSLVLPFLGVQARLAQVFTAQDGESISASMAAFAMDPIKYLGGRGLLNRIDSILMIRGGAIDGAVDEGDALPLNPQREGPANLTPDEIPPDALEYPVGYFDTPKEGNPRVKVLSHRNPVRALRGLPFEFVFYNTALPGGLAKRSGLPISVVQTEVDVIFRTYRIQDPVRKPRTGWRDSLRLCYDKHFGKLGNERNNISLCVLARPLVDAGAYPRCASSVYSWPSDNFWQLFDRDRPRHPYWSLYLGFAIDAYSTRQSNRQALLLTGDLALGSTELKAMKAHFGLRRWTEIGLTQVLHHGSQHSWKTGNAGHFGASRFVQCVPTFSKHNDHPHPIVVADLGRPRAFVADYENSVVHHFCFNV